MIRSLLAYLMIIAIGLAPCAAREIVPNFAANHGGAEMRAPSDAVHEHCPGHHHQNSEHDAPHGTCDYACATWVTAKENGQKTSAVLPAKRSGSNTELDDISLYQWTAIRGPHCRRQAKAEKHRSGINDIIAQYQRRRN